MPVQPNVIVLIADDHRFGAMGANLESQVRTPTLDRLMREGTSFERTYTMGGLTAAVCVPSRACLMTGRHTFEAVVGRQVEDYADLQTLRPELKLLPEVFRDAGYRTFGIGKWHNDPASFNRAFHGGEAIFFGGMGDHFDLPLHTYAPSGAYAAPAGSTGGRHATDVFVDAALDFLRDPDETAPFFLYLAFTAPHDPRTAPAAYADWYSPEHIDVTRFPNLYPEHPFDCGDLDVRDELLAPRPRRPGETQRHLADYYAMISHMDARIGDLLDCLAETGQADHTILLYLSDHGLGLGQHGLMGKQNLYEHSLRIPCLWRGPGIPAGRQSHRLVQHMDILPTLCGLTGMQSPPGAYGQSLFDAAGEESREGRSAILSVYKNLQRCVVEHDRKLIQYFEDQDGRAVLSYEQLFDLQTDPFETCNLAFAPGYGGELVRLRNVLRALQEECGDPLLQQISATTPPLEQA